MIATHLKFEVHSYCKYETIISSTSATIASFTADSAASNTHFDSDESY